MLMMIYTIKKVMKKTNQNDLNINSENLAKFEIMSFTFSV